MGSDSTTDGDALPAVEATHKSIEILRILKEGGPASLTEIADRLGYSKSTVHHHLATLESASYVSHDEEGYRIGLLFLDYGIYAQESTNLYRVAKSKVDALAAEVEENIWVMVEENGYGVFLYHSSKTQPVKTFTRDGYRGPLHAFAAGKAILAFTAEEKLDWILEQRGLSSETDNTVTDREELAQELRQIRDRGVAFNKRESMPGINAVAAPILDQDGRALGSISIAGPANRLKGTYLEEELAELILGVANEIEVNLAYE